MSFSSPRPNVIGRLPIANRFPVKPPRSATTAAVIASAPVPNFGTRRAVFLTVRAGRSALTNGPQRRREKQCHSRQPGDAWIAERPARGPSLRFGERGALQPRRHERQRPLPPAGLDPLHPAPVIPGPGERPLLMEIPQAADVGVLQ